MLERGFTLHLHDYTNMFDIGRRHELDPAAVEREKPAAITPSKGRRSFRRH